ncbi:MAG TPA: dinitrogenase iron-molybdenum cofactor biosynthesis protein [Pirellulales bacterium]|nr:dinitrogenase iron-molybdenum cofactor biosynthesis protein [Pirellulales bacterium]
MNPGLSREFALRIGLATRVLSNVTVAALVNGLVSQLGWPLSEEKLSRLTVSQLRNGLSQGGSIDADVELPGAEITERFSLEQLKEAVEILWGQKLGEEVDLPCVEPYEEGEMPASVRVGVASDRDEEINSHFGNCRRFLIYQISPYECRLIDVRSTDGSDESDDSSAFRCQLIRDCHVLFVQSIGGPAAAKVINAGIYPLKFAEGGHAREHLDELRQKMAFLPPPWLAKVMNVPVEDRIRFHVEEVGS